MSKKKKAPQHAKKSRLRQRFERRLTKENDTGAWQQEDEAVGRAAAGEFDTMSFDAPEEGGSYGEGPYEGAPSVSDDTMDFDMPEDAGGYGPQYGYGGEAYEAPVSASDDTMDFDVPEDGLYAITDKGLRNSRICESSLPYSVRLRCDKNLAACNRHLRRKSQVKASTEKRPNGTYTVRLELSDDMGSVMDLRLAIPREDMAAMLTERFQKSPERLYGEIMRALMSSEPEDEAP
mgnify:CR=1 FL=1